MSIPDWMNPTGLDLFQFWRFLLVVVCTVYSGIITIRLLWGWAVFLAQPDKATMVLRQYVVLHLVRVRFRRFASELLTIAGLIVLLVLLVNVH